MCKLCLCQNNLQSNRLDLKKSLENQAKKMKVLSDSKCLPSSVEGTEGVETSNVERKKSNFRSILITAIDKAVNFSKQVHKRGTIEKMFSRNQFFVCLDNEKLVDLKNVTPKNKSLQQLANEQSLLKGQSYLNDATSFSSSFLKP